MRKAGIFFIVIGLGLFILLWAVLFDSLQNNYREYSALKTGSGMQQFSGTVSNFHLYRYSVRKRRLDYGVLLYVTPDAAKQETGLFVLGRYKADLNAIHSPYTQFLNRRVTIHYRESRRIDQAHQLFGIPENEKYNLPHTPQRADNLCYEGPDGKSNCDPTFEELLRWKYYQVIRSTLTFAGLLLLALVAIFHGLRICRSTKAPK